MSIAEFPGDVYWRFQFRRMKRARKWRPSDEMKGQLADVIVIGRTLRANVEFFESFARGYSRDSNKLVAEVGRQLSVDTQTAKKRIKQLLIALELRLALRRYAWPVLRRDNSDLERFWKTRFEKLYTGLEGGMKRLAMAVKPERYEAVVRNLAVQRPALEPPKTREERMRARAQRFKAMLAKRFGVDLSCFRGIADDGLLERVAQAQSGVQTAYLEYARCTVAQLPEAERENEMKEIRNLLDRGGF